MARISTDARYTIAMYGIEAAGVLLLVGWFALIGLLVIHNYLDFALILFGFTLLSVVIGLLNETGLYE